MKLFNSYKPAITATMDENDAKRNANIIVLSYNHNESLVPYKETINLHKVWVYLRMLHISCNMCTNALPDMYALNFQATWSFGHTYQVNPLSPCYTLHVFHKNF